MTPPASGDLVFHHYVPIATAHSDDDDAPPPLKKRKRIDADVPKRSVGRPRGSGPKQKAQQAELARRAATGSMITSLVCYLSNLWLVC